MQNNDSQTAIQGKVQALDRDHKTPEHRVITLAAFLAWQIGVSEASSTEAKADPEPPKKGGWGRAFSFVTKPVSMVASGVSSVAGAIANSVFKKRDPRLQARQNVKPSPTGRYKTWHVTKSDQTTLLRDVPWFFGSEYSVGEKAQNEAAVKKDYAAYIKRSNIMIEGFAQIEAPVSGPEFQYAYMCLLIYRLIFDQKTGGAVRSSVNKQLQENLGDPSVTLPGLLKSMMDMMQPSLSSETHGDVIRVSDIKSAEAYLQERRVRSVGADGTAKFVNTRFIDEPVDLTLDTFSSELFLALYDFWEKVLMPEAIKAQYEAVVRGSLVPSAGAPARSPAPAETEPARLALTSAPYDPVDVTNRPQSATSPRSEASLAPSSTSLNSSTPGSPPMLPLNKPLPKPQSTKPMQPWASMLVGVIAATWLSVVTGVYSNALAAILPWTAGSLAMAMGLSGLCVLFVVLGFALKSRQTFSHYPKSENLNHAKRFSSIAIVSAVAFSILMFASTAGLAMPIGYSGVIALNVSLNLLVGGLLVAGYHRMCRPLQAAKLAERWSPIKPVDADAMPRTGPADAPVQYTDGSGDAVEMRPDGQPVLQAPVPGS